MSTKRRNTSSPECENPPKRLEVQSSSLNEHEDVIEDDLNAIETDERPKIDAYTGQAGAFPGLGSSGEDLFYGPANDGIDYLRMVRSEARGIPALLTARAQDASWAEHDYEEDEDGYWDDDGTYTANPYVRNQIAPTVLPRAQIEYYHSLLAQFALVRATMKCIPPLSAIEKLTSSQPISFPSENRNARASWERCLKSSPPSPTQIACMDENSTLELVRLLTTRVPKISQEKDIVSIRRTVAWIWAALGKCRDRGELGSEEISDLRQLAQKCLGVRDWLEKKDQAMRTAWGDILCHSTDNEEENVGEQTEYGLTAEIAAAKQRLQEHGDVLDIDHGGNESKNVVSTTSSGAGADAGEEIQLVEKEKLVAVDMVLTVVGEVYGQRDLLDFRKVWTDAVVSK